MKVKEIYNKTDKELEQLVKEQRQTLADLAIDIRTKQVGNVRSIRAARKLVAKGLTVLRQRELEKEQKNG